MSASLNLVPATVVIAPGPGGRFGFALRDAPAPAPEVPMPRVHAHKADQLDAEQKWILEACFLLGQVAGILDETKRLRMLTRSEDHLELMDSQAAQISIVMRELARRAEKFV